MISFLKAIIYTPLYNFLVFVLAIPHIDAGIAVVVLTVLVKIALFPLTKKASLAQAKMKGYQDELAAIKEKHKDPQVQAMKVMEFYREKKINPFSSIGSILIQIPIIYSLYHIFLRSGLPMIDTSMLYTFIQAPTVISMNFLGLIDISQKSFFLALLAAVSSFIQMHYSSRQSPQDSTPDSSKNPDISKVMARQMKYTFPAIVFFISWKISGVVALYWFTSNVVSIIQDYLIRRSLLQSKQP